MPTTTPIQYATFGHLHILVDDLDEAGDFYRDVLDFVEMQSHDRLVNKGAATYYGLGDEYENIELSLRFLFIPDVLTIKLVKMTRRDLPTRSQAVSAQASGFPVQSRAPYYRTRGVGPVNLYVSDLDSTYEQLVRYARDYRSRFKFQLLSPPTFLSPILPHQIGARPGSALYEQHDILEDMARTFPKRAKFQLIDPFGVTWEFNNNVI